MKKEPVSQTFETDFSLYFCITWHSFLVDLELKKGKIKNENKNWLLTTEVTLENIAHVEIIIKEPMRQNQTLVNKVFLSTYTFIPAWEMVNVNGCLTIWQKPPPAQKRVNCCCWKLKWFENGDFCLVPDVIGDVTKAYQYHLKRNCSQPFGSSLITLPQ